MVIHSITLKAINKRQDQLFTDFDCGALQNSISSIMAIVFKMLEFAFDVQINQILIFKKKTEISIEQETKAAR